MQRVGAKTARRRPITGERWGGAANRSPNPLPMISCGFQPTVTKQPLSRRGKTSFRDFLLTLNNTITIFSSLRTSGLELGRLVNSIKCRKSDLMRLQIGNLILQIFRNQTSALLWNLYSNFFYIVI